MHGRNLVSEDAGNNADILTVQCAAVSEMIRLIAILPEHCLRNIQILPHNVVRAISKTAPSLHYLYLRSLAKCIEVTQIDDSVELSEEDIELVRCYFLTLSKGHHLYEPLTSVFENVDSFLEDGYIISFNMSKAVSLRLSLSLQDAERQTIEVATQLEAISRGTSSSEFAKRWPKYGSKHYRQIQKTLGCDESIEVSAMESAANALLHMLSTMEMSDFDNITIIPSKLISKLSAICPSLLPDLLEPLIACLSIKEIDIDSVQSMTGSDKGLSFLFWHSIASVLHSYEPVFHVRQYAEALSARYTLQFSVDVPESAELNEKVEQLLSKSTVVTKQYRAVKAGIGHDMFLKWWPNAGISRFRELRTYSGVKLDSGHVTSAKAEFGVYDYYCDVLNDVKESSCVDEEDAMIKAWLLTKNRFGEIMPLVSFILAQQTND